MFSLSKKSGNLLGIDISSSAVKLIELSRKGSNYRVDSYAVSGLADGVTSERDINEAEKVSEAIKQAVKNSRTKSRRCALGIPSSMSINKIISIPASIPTSELEAQISIEAEQYIPYPMDEVNFDFEVLGPSETSKEMMDVLIAGTRTENVEVRLAAAEMAGLNVEIVDLESNAVELLFKTMINDLDKHDVVAAVDFGASMTGINVFEHGKVVFSREQVFGGRFWNAKTDENGKCVIEGLPEGEYYIDHNSQKYAQPAGMHDTDMQYNPIKSKDEIELMLFPAASFIRIIQCLHSSHLCSCDR